MTVNITHFDGLSLEENVKNNFKQADMEAALAHILQTRYNAITLAKRFGCDPEQAASASMTSAALYPHTKTLTWPKRSILKYCRKKNNFPTCCTKNYLGSSLLKRST